jgi:hypothetical protein
LAVAARACSLVEKILKIAASRVEEQKERDADEPKLGCVALRRKSGAGAAKIFAASGGGSERACDRAGNLKSTV